METDIFTLLLRQDLIVTDLRRNWGLWAAADHRYFDGMPASVWQPVLFCSVLPITRSCFFSISRIKILYTKIEILVINIILGTHKATNTQQGDDDADEINPEEESYSGEARRTTFIDDSSHKMENI